MAPVDGRGQKVEEVLVDLPPLGVVDVGHGDLAQAAPDVCEVATG